MLRLLQLGAWMAAAGAAGPEAAFETLDGEPEALLAQPHDPAAPFSIQYTSGTTARPKAVLWNHANALWGAQMSAMHEALGPPDVHLVHRSSRIRCYAAGAAA